MINLLTLEIPTGILTGPPGFRHEHYSLLSHVIHPMGWAPHSRPGASRRVKTMTLQVISGGCAPGRLRILIRKRTLSDKDKTVESQTPVSSWGL